MCIFFSKQRTSIRPEFLLPAAVLIAASLLSDEQASPTATTLHLQKAEEAYAAEKWEAAAEEYRQVVKLDPQNAPAYARLGVVYQKLNRLNDSQVALEKAVVLDPDLPDVDVLLGMVDVSLQQYAKAIPLLESAVNQSKDDLPLRLASGERLVDLYFIQDQGTKAVSVVEKLLKLAPDNPDVLYTASRVYPAMWKKVVGRMYAEEGSGADVRQGTRFVSHPPGAG